MKIDTFLIRNFFRELFGRSPLYREATNMKNIFIRFDGGVYSKENILGVGMYECAKRPESACIYKYNTSSFAHEIRIIFPKYKNEFITAKSNIEMSGFEVIAYKSEFFSGLKAGINET